MVELVKVDVVSLQPGKARVQLAADVQRGAPFDECIPWLPVPAAGAYHQVGDGWVITHRVGILSGSMSRGRGCGACCVVVPGAGHRSGDKARGRLCRLAEGAGIGR